jgi:hypothetical protein
MVFELPYPSNMADTNSMADRRRKLWDASDRYFRHSLDLTKDLKEDPATNLNRLRQKPETFGPVRTSLMPHELAKAHARLIAAAEAYVALLTPASLPVE